MPSVLSASLPDRHFERIEEEADVVQDVESIGKSFELEVNEDNVLDHLHPS